MSRSLWFVPAGALCAASLLVTVACQNQQAESSQPAYQPTATIKELMLSVVDPSADDVWLAVTTEVNATGIIETVPQNDEQWAMVRRGAVTLMESANLLQMPGRHMARPGERSETPGVELEPQEMEALIDQDRAAWNARARALHDAAAEVLGAVTTHDTERIFELGEQIERACENCHSQYWYPNERVPTE